MDCLNAECIELLRMLCVLHLNTDSSIRAERRIPGFLVCVHRKSMGIGSGSPSR